MYSFDKILVPSDRSECADKALGVAISLATRFDAEVFLMFVKDTAPGSKIYDTNAATKSEMKDIEDVEGELIKEYQKHSTVIAKALGVSPLGRDKLAVRVASGKPADQICSAAEEAKVDLIVMGTHGRSSLKDFFVGSTTEKVVRNATCAVLAVKPDGYPYLRD